MHASPLTPLPTQGLLEPSNLDEAVYDQAKQVRERTRPTICFLQCTCHRPHSLTAALLLHQARGRAHLHLPGGVPGVQGQVKARDRKGRGSKDGKHEEPLARVHEEVGEVDRCAVPFTRPRRRVLSCDPQASSLAR